VPPNGVWGPSLALDLPEGRPGGLGNVSDPRDWPSVVHHGGGRGLMNTYAAPVSLLVSGAPINAVWPRAERAMAPPKLFRPGSRGLAIVCVCSHLPSEGVNTVCRAAGHTWRDDCADQRYAAATRQGDGKPEHERCIGWLQRLCLLPAAAVAGEYIRGARLPRVAGRADQDHFPSSQRFPVTDRTGRPDQAPSAPGPGAIPSRVD
jgi:hypothetical protein